MSCSHTRRSILLFLLVGTLAAFCGPSVSAQSGKTSVRGTVLDQDGRTISGANVKLISPEKGLVRTASTNDGGNFAFPSIPPGTYRMEVSTSGFKTFVQNEVRALVDTSVNVSVVMEAGNINEVVTVKDNTAESLLNRQDASLGNVFVAQQVTQLPTEARDVINLLTLQPGVTRFGYVAGVRSDQANLTLDGVDINNPITNNIFNPNLRLNAEAIEEFRVTTANANANQGRSSGAQISLVTKSGTNQFRGALFLTGRRTGWTANNFFNNRDGVERPKLDRNVFGGAVGGPIWKDRAFFFYSYEGERTTDGETVVRVVPLPTLGQGIVVYRNAQGQLASLNCSQLAAAFTNTNGCNPAALAIFAGAASRYAANSFDMGDSTVATRLNTGGYRFNADHRIKKNSQVLRLDLNLNAKQQGFFRVNYIDDIETISPQFPDTPQPSTWSHPRGFVVGHNWAIGNSLFNNFRIGLTRKANSNLGDSDANAIDFTLVYSPRLPQRTLSAVDSLVNVTDDLTWVWRSHTFQFGTNIRLLRSRPSSLGNSFDTATVNSALNVGRGESITARLNSPNFDYGIPDDQFTNVQRTVAAVVGRYARYTASFTYFRNGQLQPSGTAREREFKSEAYDFYLQDIWKLSPTVTITAGLAYDVSRPVYEAGGYEVKPNIGLSEYFARRTAGAANGTPYNQPLVFDLAGTANGRSPLYRWDRNNFQPRFAAAWSPNFAVGFWGRLFGRNSESVIRGGFAVTNDYLTPALVAQYDAKNIAGFTAASETPFAPYDLVGANPGPPFTGFDQNIRTLPNLPLPAGTLTFPLQPANQGSPQGKEGGFDESLISPINYNWNLTYERTLPRGLLISISYLGHSARNLLQSRDAAAVANFVDPQSGMDWSTAATQLEILRQRGTPAAQVGQIPYFANLFPATLSATLGCNPSYNQTQAVFSLVSRSTGNCGTKLDWTSVQRRLSLLSSRFPGEHIFYQPQFGSYAAWSSVGRSDYHGLTITVRQRLGTRLTADLNYSYSRSLDDGSGLQVSSVLSSAGFTINPLRPEDMYAASDFDMRHILNANAILTLPVGKGEPIWGNVSNFANVFLGGWQLTGIFRYNSGLPISAPRETGWTTNVTIQSYATRTTDIQTCPTRGGGLFGCNTKQAFRSFRNAYPGETGERNVFRLPGFWVLDMGLGKTFDLPKEGHKLQFRWEIFNLTNTQSMGGVATYVVGPDPQNDPVPPNWSKFTSIQGSPRSMQFVLRYTF